MIIVALMVAGASGALLRSAVDHVVQRRVRSAGSDFPLGIMVVNLSGSFVLGLLTGAAVRHGIPAFWTTVVGTGLVGAYTTFSTFTFDTVSLAEEGEWAGGAANVLLSLTLGLAAAAAGLALGSLG
jgi:fluoride exporter